MLNNYSKLILVFLFSFLLSNCVIGVETKTTQNEEPPETFIDDDGKKDFEIKEDLSEDFEIEVVDPDKKTFLEEETVPEKTGTEFGNPDSIEENDGTEFGNPESIPNFDGTEFGNSESKVEKGPFQMDSSVSIQELNSQLQSTGRSHHIFTEDHLGSFSLPLNLQSYEIEIITRGFYFNEVSGESSIAPLTLGAYASLKDYIAPNVNILTTLAQKRIKKLITEDGLSFVDAESQAKDEVLRAFHINNEETKNFDELSIQTDSTGGAILLAISVILQGELSTDALSRLIADIREDLKNNGMIDSEEINQQICNQTRKLDPISIRNNLENFYIKNNIENFVIPFFEDYLDSDCNGTINKNDPESFIFFKREKHNNFNALYYSVKEFNGRLWMMGRARSGLLYSEDLKNWRDINAIYDDDIESIHYRQHPGINWRNRNPLLIPFNDRLYILGGRNYMDTYTDREFFNDEVNTTNIISIDRNNEIIQIQEKNREEEFINAHLDFSLNDNTFFNFSDLDHNYFIYEDQLYLYSIKDNSQNSTNQTSAGFFGLTKTPDFINWEIYQSLDENNLHQLRLRLNAFDTQILNNYIIVLKKINEFESHLMAKNMNDLNEHYELFLGHQINPQSIIPYQNTVITYNQNPKSITEISINQNEFETNTQVIPNYSEEWTEYKEPFVFKNMIHQVAEEDIILVFGHYKFYRDYNKSTQ
jgi:hypothetical protein